MVKLKSKLVAKRPLPSFRPVLKPAEAVAPSVPLAAIPIDSATQTLGEISHKLQAMAEGLQWLENLCITTNSKLNEIARDWSVEHIKTKASIDHLADLILDAGIDTEELAADLKEAFVILERN